MSEPRTFLQRYSGESVETLLALEPTHRIDSLVLAFEQGLDEKAHRVGYEALTTEELTILAIEALEREVNNGGYHQFFLNATQYAPTIVDALDRIDCPKVAAITTDAIAALHVPAITRAKIESVIYEDDEVRDGALSKCDDRYYECPEPIADQLFAFIKTNRNSIRLT
jgi:hypothetical protein